MSFRSPDGGGALSRRTFVRGTALSGASLLMPGWTARADTQAQTPQILSGTEFDLRIGRTPVNITGRTIMAPSVNGSVPGPTLRWRQGDIVTLRVHNALDETSSIHWHGIRVPSEMDGVPGLSFAGIPAGQKFTYRFPLHQSGTYWYHSHSGFQEQQGLYGALIVAPRAGEAQHAERDHVVVLSDWTDADPAGIVDNLKFQSDYYNFRQRTVGTFFSDAARDGLGPTIRDRLRWGRMRMSATDIADVSGATYTYLCNGQAPAANWTGLFRPGERVRLRFINASAMTLFDVRVPGLDMTVVQADGNDVEPFVVDEFRIGVAETYDVIVRPLEIRAYTIFAQSEDRTGFARGTLSPRGGLAAPIPPMDPRPVRTMIDMGMGGMAGMDAGSAEDRKAADHGDAMPGMAMDGMEMGSMPGPMSGPEPDSARLKGSIGVDNVAMMPRDRLDDPGDGLENNGRRVLTYAMLRATRPGADPRPPSRDIVLHLTGNMERYIWGFDGKKFSQAEPIRVGLGERVRFVLINDTMMEHPIHLHGLWSELENGEDAFRPYKHTVIVQPGERLSYLVTADVPGRWAFHCHLMYHMELGMFRTVVVA
ncbi:copper resistance system multicopper oxidase [Acetobacteraceae bacterium KSS8]|uniref:Copper resistance system multicopper oxidase n=1 Tax=Endosaccharibacter trunci TaxID=2812733 RepID=A0ABT1WA76_9PROT|nr:copper resistance system multicopper oxidase [Acetobacteraceae bacterium KSS8]